MKPAPAAHATRRPRPNATFRAGRFPGLARPLLLALAAAATVLTAPGAGAQDDGDAPARPLRGSIIEDRAARKLVEAGDARLDADEQDKATEIWRSVIERYPRSRVRFQAHLRLGNFFLDKKNAYERARKHFEAVAAEENPDEEERALASLKVGVCYYEAHTYGKAFQVLREVIEEFPLSPHVNDAYYYIGLGHFKQGHYSRAIAALEKVGTALTDKDRRVEKSEAGKRLFIKIEDADLAILKPGETVAVQCQARTGDVERVECHPVGRNVRVVLGSIPTALGRPRKNNGRLEVTGGEEVAVTYFDNHTADAKFNQRRLKTVLVVGNAHALITDGSFREPLQGVVVGKQVNFQVTDADRDRTDRGDQIRASVEVLRAKTQAEIENELADRAARGVEVAAEVEAVDGDDAGAAAGDGGSKIDRLKRVDHAEVTLTEAFIPRTRRELPTKPPGAAETGSTGGPARSAPGGNTAAGAAGSAAPALPADPGGGARPSPTTGVDEFVADVERDAVDDSIHSGVFRGSLPVDPAKRADPGDDRLQAQPGDIIRITYQDELNTGPGPLVATAEATCIEGNLGGVRVTRTQIRDEELRLKTKLKTASALTYIGNHYEEFGLDDKAQLKFQEALEVCEEIAGDARRLGGAILEETYVQLWRIYFSMGELNLALATSQRLQREFPESTFVDEAILQQAQVAREQGEFNRAITLFQSILKLRQSDLRGEAQFGIAECYEQMATAAETRPGAAAPLFERSFQAYKKVFESFPESGRVGDAVAKMANFYYQKKDYARAIDVFENVLTEHPDANFLDVILFNYGRCLYRTDRKNLARRQFDQLIDEFPESALAPEAKRISEALAKAGF